MHITDTIDFVHVLSGEMIMELDRREVLVRKGDTIIMRGAWHNWRNEGTEPCTVASVLVGANRSDKAAAQKSGQPQVTGSVAGN
nr:cupin domain-containing protein [Rhodococcus sp. 14C212]